MAEQRQQDLLTVFRSFYHQFHDSIRQAQNQLPDAFVLQRLGDDLSEYIHLVDQYDHIFERDEYQTLSHNLHLMINDIRTLRERALQSSHRGRPQLVNLVQSGGRGRPRIVIDPDFLRWAYSRRSTSGIADYLGVSRQVVRNALLEHGISRPGVNPFPPAEIVTEPLDNLFDQPAPPEGEGAVLPEDLPQDQQPSGNRAYLSTISDTDLDNLVLRLRSHYRRAGVSTMYGLLRRLGHILPQERIRQSLLRIDPVARVFDRVRIRRRGYSVPGPMALWHHDGQHGLIMFGIVIHAFIDGYSRFIVAIRAHDNNRANTVLELFLQAAQVYGVPSRARGDHGVENIQVAAFMNAINGEGRGSYIWGRSVHNVRIERLWVDVTVQVGNHWYELFMLLASDYGLQMDNQNHIWLLHRLFLETINEQLLLFAEAWNEHKLNIRDGANRSPEDMFVFDAGVFGFRGDTLPPEELEVYGMDWDELQDDDMLDILRARYSQEAGSSWVTGGGPPSELSGVELDPPAPDGPLSVDQLDALYQHVHPLLGSAEPADVFSLWAHGLAYARQMAPELF